MSNYLNYYERRSGHVVSPDIEEGSYAMGILGAALGALAGGVLWFIFVAFLKVFCIYIGLFAALFSLWGYKKMNGRRHVTFAVSTIVILSLACLFIAQVAAYFLILYMDPDNREIADLYGIPLRSLILKAVFQPEVLRELLPDFIFGMLFGLIGIIVSFNQIKDYCLVGSDPGFLPVDDRLTMIIPAGMAIPDRFEVREKKSQRYTFTACGVLLILGGFALLIFFAASDASFFGPDRPLANWSVNLLLSAILVLCGIVLLGMSRRNITVIGSILKYQPILGKRRRCRISEIVSVRRGFELTTRVLCDTNGKARMSFDIKDENFDMIAAYLASHGIMMP